jgi:hypothetical protein
MNKTKKSNLTLSTQTLRVLTARELRTAAGGTDLVTVDDPITRTTSGVATYKDCIIRK